MSDSMHDMKEQILRDYPRLSIDDTFQFACHAGLACFGTCCGDVNIALTPYDVLRLERRLGLRSDEMVERHLLLPEMAPGQKLPLVLLKMQEGTKRCPFVTAEGCSVYEDRPWACRMYPVGIASARTDKSPDAEEFYFILRDERCDGLKQARTTSIRDWMKEQGTAPYDEANEAFKALSLHPFLTTGYALEPQHRQAFFTACYDVDRFRELVFGSSFLKKFEVEPEVLEAIRTDDEALLAFAYRWLRFAMYHERTVKLDAGYERAKKQVLRVP
jgi:Fe-S-cluster containining protein